MAFPIFERKYHRQNLFETNSSILLADSKINCKIFFCEKPENKYKVDQNQDDFGHHPPSTKKTLQ